MFLWIKQLKFDVIKGLFICKELGTSLYSCGRGYCTLTTCVSANGRPGGGSHGAAEDNGTTTVVP